MEEQKSTISLSEEEYILIRDLVFDRFGITLPETKKGLIVTRLQSLLKKYNLNSFKAYYHFVLDDNQVERLGEMVNRISTNFSYFYREEKHFEFFTQTAFPEVLKKIQARGSKDIRIWSAGCSSGEEPYTLMILMHEALGMNYSSYDAGLLATDISERVLTEARTGRYGGDRLQKLPPQLISKYFVKLSADEYQVKEELRREITFRRFNLMNEKFPFKKPFHMIFCRNVMIYFDKPTRDALVRRYIASLEVGGYLYIGHSETLSKDVQGLRYVMPALYQKV